MMASLSITAVKHNGGEQQNTTVGSSQIYMNENVPTGTIVGKVEGFAGNPSTMNLVIEPADRGYPDRYELWNGTFVDDDGVTQTGWFIRVKNGGSTFMDYEDPDYGYNPDFPELGGARHDQVTFKFYTGPVNFQNLTDQLVFDTLLNDIVNEGPPDTPPTLNVTAATYSVESTGADIAPFNGKVSINDAPTDRQTLSISFASATGVFEGRTPTSDANGIKTYTFTDTTANLNALLAGLQFDAADQDAGGTVNTVFTIQVKPEGAQNWSATDSASIVVQADDNDNAAGSVAGSTTVSTPVGTAMSPFADISVSDQEGDQVTVRVTFASGSGSWGGIGNGGGVTVDSSTPGVLTFTGSYSNVTTLLDSVTFTPSSATATPLAVTVKDSRAGHTAADVATITVTGMQTQAPTVQFGSANSTVTMDEGLNGAVTYTYTLKRSGDLSSASDVAWSVVGSGANPAAGSDFAGGVLPAGTARFNAGSDTATITVTVAGDAAVEPTEQFMVNLLANGSTNVVIGGNATATGVITNDDAVFSLSTATASVQEGNSGFVDYQFTVTRTGSGLPADVTWSISTGSGIDANDFEDLIDQVHFDANELTKTFVVRVRGDAQVEANETFTVALTATTSGSIGSQNTAQGQIINDDQPPQNQPPHTIRLDSGLTDIVGENLVVGRPVGTLSATDETAAANITYSFVAGFDGAGHFRINNTTKEIELATALNFEEAVTTTPGAGLEQDGIGKFYRLKVVATDNANPALSSEQEIRVYVTDANEAPNAPQYTSNGAIAETVGNGAQVGTIAASDPDGTAPSIVFTDTNTTTSSDGAFEIVGSAVRVKDATLIQVMDGASPTFFYNVKATDGSLSSVNTSISITVNDVPPPLNQPPTINVNGGTQVIGATANGPSVKAFYDIGVDDFEDNDLTMTISFVSSHGVLRNQNNQVIAVKSDDSITKTYEFTGKRADLNAILDELRFDAQDRNDGGIVDTNFTVKVWDIDHQSSPAVNNQITVSTVLTNRAPTIRLEGSKTFRVNDINDAVYAFGGFDLFDIERDQLTLTIKFDEDDGDLDVANLPDPVRVADQKVYTFANRTAGELEVILDNLRFNATDRSNQNSGTVETTFTVEVSDGGNTASNTELKVITDIVNKQPPTQNQAPKDLALTIPSNIVNEYTAVNLEIGTLSATDGNGDVLTYKLLDNAGGRFAISGNNKLVLAGPGVNFAEAKSHQIKVEVTDGKGGRAEQIFIINIGDQLTLNKRGTKKADKLNGTALDDILKGGTGTVKDIIKGLAGDDQLYGENGNDSVLGGDGIDRLYGGNGDDVLKGEAGNDTLFGEAGNDKLYGGAGSDTFVFNKKPAKTSNFDRIYDFKSVQGDKIFLDNAVFKNLGKLGTFDAPAKLDVSMFKAGKAKDKNDYLVYKSGVLYYDADGSGKGAAVEIVKVGGLKATDLFVI
jgi:Ca2+-binding RTX toxin-like protein